MPTLKHIPQIEKYLGKKVQQIIRFDKPGAFKSLYAAKHWCTLNGYSFGEVCGDEPIGIMKGDGFGIQKWKNIKKEALLAMDGVIIPNFPKADFREGELLILLF